MHMLRQWCSLSMLHRTCESMHWGVRLGGLSMPNGCTLCMPIYFKTWGIKSTLSHIWFKIELIFISIKCEVCKAIDWYQWGELLCDEEYIGETSRTFEEKF